MKNMYTVVRDLDDSLRFVKVEDKESQLSLERNRQNGGAREVAVGDNAPLAVNYADIYVPEGHRFFRNGPGDYKFVPEDKLAQNPYPEVRPAGTLESSFNALGALLDAAKEDMNRGNFMDAASKAFWSMIFYPLLVIDSMGKDVKAQTNDGKEADHLARALAESRAAAAAPAAPAPAPAPRGPGM
jgi:hypothetical protein